MTDTFIIATGNTNKVREFKRILNPLGYDCISAKEFGINMDEAVENGSTFEENSLIKARFAYDKAKMPVIADDSGLCVDALNGQPGIYSARYAGDDASDSDKCEKLLYNLTDVPDDRRGASFHCNITCILSDDEIFSVEGICRGKIGRELKGNEGFGYDPLFIPDGMSKVTMAMLSPLQKDSISHRGNALRMLEFELRKRLNTERNEHSC